MAWGVGEGRGLGGDLTCIAANACTKPPGYNTHNILPGNNYFIIPTSRWHILLLMYFIFNTRIIKRNNKGSDRETVSNVRNYYCIRTWTIK